MAIPINKRIPYTVRLNPAESNDLIRAKVERLREFFGTKALKIIRESNREGLEWMQKRAVQNLEQKIQEHGRPDFRTGILENAILNNKYSRADINGIRFIIDSVIRHDVPYFASLEYGDRSQIGRRIPFFFFGTKTGPRSLNRPGLDTPGATNPQDTKYRHHHEVSTRRSTSKDPQAHGVRAPYRADRIIGPREAKSMGDAGLINSKRFTALIQRPVPRYAYGQDAGYSFISENIYEQILDRRIGASGLSAEGVRLVLTGQ